MISKEDLDFYFDKMKFAANSYYDLVHSKINHILLISTYYDAFIFEQDGILSEQFFGEFDQLSLGNIPRITSVPTAEEALTILAKNEIDLVISTMRIGEITPFELAEKIKQDKPTLPVLLLLNMESDIEYLICNPEKMRFIDNVFLWNGDSKIFLAMIKYVEDKQNIEYDIKSGLVHVILLVEDSVKYYSRFLPILYSEIMSQTQRLISAELSIVNKRRRMRIRPKVLLVNNYNDAVEMIQKYRESLISVISDVKYPRDGAMDDTAGIRLLQKIQAEKIDVALLLQSSEQENQEEAQKLGAHFLLKNSDSLLLDLRRFIEDHLGFGDLVFRNQKKEEIARVSNLLEFENLLFVVPAESILYHASRNQFSAWLIAHGELQMARRIKPLKIENFSDPEEMRVFMIDVLKEIREKKNRGKVIEFDQFTIDPEGQVIRLCEGSLGGKGRGIAFINSLINSLEMDSWYENVSLKTPKTFIIGTSEFDLFIERNKIIEKILTSSGIIQDVAAETASLPIQKITLSDEEIKAIFRKGELSKPLKTKLKLMLRNSDFPLAVRSSGLLEDSQSQPFAGVYNTYMLRNNEADFSIRLQKLEDAVKKVFASVFQKNARQYIRNINFKVEEEKMAVIIQNIVGTEFSGLHYPHISGVAQSYNYYPTSYLKSTDGIASLAIGLGKSVVDGENVYLFCPKHPKLEILPMEKMIKNNQKKIYAIDLYGENEKADDDMIQVLLRKLRDNGSLDHLVSVWDQENNHLKVGLYHKGPLIVNFPNILKHNFIPLGEIIFNILKVCEKAMGVPIEIEFALKLSNDLNRKRHTFYLLQIRPLNIQMESVSINAEELNKAELMLYSEHGMGNGIIKNIRDIVVFDPVRFDNTKTEEMQLEVEAFNEMLKEQNRPYLLIGPGRWGSRDRFLGIPVVWSQISHAKAIVEVGLEGYNVDASQGTHFFHNLMSMNVGYLNVSYTADNDSIDLDWLMQQPQEGAKEYFRHLRFSQPLKIIIDGKSGLAAIWKTSDQEG